MLDVEKAKFSNKKSLFFGSIVFHTIWSQNIEPHYPNGLVSSYHTRCQFGSLTLYHKSNNIKYLLAFRVIRYMLNNLCLKLLVDYYPFPNRNTENCLWNQPKYLLSNILLCSFSTRNNLIKSNLKCTLYSCKHALFI